MNEVGGRKVERVREERDEREKGRKLDFPVDLRSTASAAYNSM